MIDLVNLPPPQIVETLDYEAILAATVADMDARMAAAGVIYDVSSLETGPLKVNCEVDAYRELLVRARINDAFRANLLAFATKGDLDHLGAFYDVLRMAGETDARFRERIILAIQGRSPGGTAPRYRYVAMSASLRVADAIVYRVGTSPVVHVAIYATDNNGVADAALLDLVRAAVNAPEVIMVSDTLDVRTAAFRTVSVTANVWLLPQTSDSVLTTLPVTLKTAWDSVRSLGFDMTRSWLTARLMTSGIQRVEILSPAADQIAAPEEALAMGTVTLNNMGRAY